MKDADTIVIGSGMGGLTTGLCLAKAGQKVLILEQHYVPGGWCHSFLRDGYKFSPGVHFVGHLHEGGNGRKLYEGLGIANYITFFRQNPEGYDHNIVGDQKFKMPAGMDALREKLKQRFPKERRGIDGYMDISEKIYEELYIALDVSSWKKILLMPYRTRHIGRMGWWKTRTVLNYYLKNPYLKTFLTLQCGNYGLPPKLSPFAVHTVVTNHCMAGTCYPRGGGAALVKAFTKNIKKFGGEIKCGQGVKRILIEGTGQNRRAIGVELMSGETLRAKNIVSNADPHKTYLGMVGGEYLSKNLVKKLSKTQYSTGALNLFLTVDMDLRKAGMDSGNIWYSKKPDLDASYDEFMHEDILAKPEFPGMFISSPTLKDPVSYDGKYHTLEIITFVNYDAFKKFENTQFGIRSKEYEVFKEKVIAKMLRTLEKTLPGVTERIVMKELGTPTTSNYYVNTTKGNIYGPDKLLSQVGPFNYRAKTEIPGLFLTGAATLSHGIMGATNSGLNTAAAMLGCHQDDLLYQEEGQKLRIYEAEDDSNWPEWLHKKGEVKRQRGKRKMPIFSRVSE